ncbi:hypothetical protein HX109_05955 [Galbibacter sp. BG1]|uniref:hypothetical protein n=1 Tax=Galbibacter sp. BG1 TaxID=1170699 RepID=UPI0015C1BBBE|nr:hypothetical protein [Galbibacter sp. BG1]QLE01129.1 hypothetical protein HX109_05955 [Galbibacter sp. BG1]
MNNNIKLLIICALVVNFMFSIVLTITGLVSGTYLNDYKNYLSLKNPEVYMEIDSLKFLDAYDNVSSRRYLGNYEIDGVLVKKEQKMKIIIGKEKYFNFNIEKHAVYRSKLTKDYYLKDAPIAYYNSELRSFIMTMYFKISFFPLLGVAVYFAITLIKEYRFRI